MSFIGDDGGDGTYGMMGISDYIIDIFQNLRQKTNTLVSTIPNTAFKKEFMPSFCKDFTMKHHSIRNTIVRYSLSRGFSMKSLSSDCENNRKLRRLDIKSFVTEIVDGYDSDLDLSPYQA
jgi:hypothetical protein